MKVLKFGGTSVGSADRIRAVAELINNGESQYRGFIGNVRNHQHLG